MTIDALGGTAVPIAVSNSASAICDLIAILEDPSTRAASCGRVVGKCEKARYPKAYEKNKDEHKDENAN